MLMSSSFSSPFKHDITGILSDVGGSGDERFISDIDREREPIRNRISRKSIRGRTRTGRDLVAASSSRYTDVLLLNTIMLGGCSVLDSDWLEEGVD